MDKDARVALFQQWFSDNIPHNKALGLKVIGASRGFASMQLDWREELVGNPETGVLAGGPLTAMLDGCCGMSVATMLKAPEPFATLDLRIDYVRPAEPGKPVIAEADAAAAGTFMLGTKGKVTRPQMIGADKLIATDGSKA